MKRFLALLLALAMLFCLAACNNVEIKNNEEEDKDEVLTLPSVKVGMAIKDPGALLALFQGSNPGLDIKDLYLEMGTDDKAGLLSLGATLDSKNYNVNLFLGEALVLSAPELLDKNYGASMTDLLSWYESMMSQLFAPSAGAVGSNSALGIMEQIDTEKAGKLLDKYYELLISELKAANGISTSTEDGKTVLTGTLNGDAFATICVNIIETLFSDDDFFSLLADASGMSASEVKQQLTADKPSKDELLEQAKDAFSQSNLALTVNKIALDSDNLPVAVDLKLSVISGGESGTIAFAYDLEALTLSFSVDAPSTKASLTIGNGKFDMRSNSDGESNCVHFETSDSSFSGYVEQNGTKVAEVSLSYTDTELNFKMSSNGSEIGINAKISDTTAEGTMTMDGAEMAKVLFDRKVEGSLETLTLKSITAQGQSVDFSEAGISFYTDSDYDMPEAPEYTDITTLDEDDLEAIGQAFLEDNADLLELFSGMGTPSQDSWEDDYVNGDWDENYDYY